VGCGGYSLDHGHGCREQQHRRPMRKRRFRRWGQGLLCHFRWHRSLLL
jgi:hypothetical protein